MCQLKILQLVKESQSCYLILHGASRLHNQQEFDCALDEKCDFDPKIHSRVQGGIEGRNEGESGGSGGAFGGFAGGAGESADA